MDPNHNGGGGIMTLGPARTNFETAVPHNLVHISPSLLYTKIYSVT